MSFSSKSHSKLQQPHCRKKDNFYDSQNDNNTNIYDASFSMQNEKLQWLAMERLDKFLSNDWWTYVNLSAKHLYYEDCPPITFEVYSPPFVSSIAKIASFSEIIPNAEWKPCAIGDAYGPPWSNHWFRLQLQPPKKWIQQCFKKSPANDSLVKPPEIHFRWNSEFSAYQAHNTPYAYLILHCF